MKLINNVVDIFFSGCNKIPFVGFVTGPTRAVIGLAQFALNIIGSVFLAIPSFWIDGESSFHAINLIKDAFRGLYHVGYGAVEFIPLSGHIGTILVGIVAVVGLAVLFAFANFLK